MKRVSDYQQFLESEAACIKRLMQAWRPAPVAASEKDYEQHLFEWLATQLPDVPLVAQYGIAKGKADIVIQDSHVIELKLGLTDVLEFDRCVGQLERYRQKWVCKDRGPVYLVVVGESDSEFRDMLDIWIAHANANTSLPSFWGGAFHLIEKRPTAKA
jgi:hypothetical protein